MKAILEFDRLEDEDEFQAAIHAIDYKCAVAEFDEIMRKLLNKGPGYFGEPEFANGHMINIDWLWEKWRKAVDNLDDIT